MEDWWPRASPERKKERKNNAAQRKCVCACAKSCRCQANTTLLTSILAQISRDFMPETCRKQNAQGRPTGAPARARGPLRDAEYHVIYDITKNDYCCLHQHLTLSLPCEWPQKYTTANDCCDSCCNRCGDCIIAVTATRSCKVIARWFSPDGYIWYSDEEGSHPSLTTKCCIDYDTKHNK